MSTKVGTNTGCLLRICASLALVFACTSSVRAQSQKPLLLRDPAITKTQIAFGYAGNIWIANRDGSDPRRLTSGGHEAKPVFSPDGSQVAFARDSDGTRAVYVVPAVGGEPRRITYHPADLEKSLLNPIPDTVGWTPDGSRILFASRREAFASSVVQLFTVPVEGGFATQVPLARASDASFSPDGARIAYVPGMLGQPAWKRYRGGQTRPIWIANLADSTIQATIPRDNSDDFNPMRVGDIIYFLSDRNGPVTEFDLRAISSRPGTVSGGDVLVQLTAPQGANWVAQLNGRDVTQSFRLAERSRSLLALVTGLKTGKNALEIRVDGTIRSKLEIVDHPLAGPIFSGPHQEPFMCQTVANGLGPAMDSDCSAKTVVQYYYKSTEATEGPAKETTLAAIYPTPVSLAPGFKPYNASAPPTDMAKTVTSDGETVNYIVRREVGVINRAVYDIKFLHQPGQSLPSPWTHPNPGWNGRLVYEFEGGCGSGYHQGVLIGAVGKTQEPMLAQGYAVATSTLNIFGNNCNDRVSAETLSMVKEYFVKRYGVPAHTIGVGRSGGSMQQHLIAQNYPGLLDGIITEYSFPDMTSTAQSVTDCSLLDHVFNTSKERWTEQQKTAASGVATWHTCQSWSSLAIANPRKFCERAYPAEQEQMATNLIYDRTTNPRGVRCDLYDNEINVFARDPRTGFALRPLDNVGVQYGLVAFNAGKISFQQFIELNETIGGYDDDGNIVVERMEAAPEALDFAYSRGLILTGGGGLSQIPIIDWRSYLDDEGDAHDRLRSSVTRARLIAANGNADNQVILVGPRVDSLTDLLSTSPMLTVHRQRDIVQMDRWLDNVAADGADGTLSAKAARDKPADLAEGCWATDGEKIVEHASYDREARCNQLYPPHADPRIAAGGPLTDDILKCALKPISTADYFRPLTADQLQRLKSIFPAGVCDYSRPGVGQEVTQATWQIF